MSLLGKSVQQRTLAGQVQKEKLQDHKAEEE